MLMQFNNYQSEVHNCMHANPDPSQESLEEQ